MPLRKTDKGWFWGGQGPFPSKAKALSVARAAYASGYKEGIEMNHDAIKKMLSTLMCGQICLRLIHWNTTSDPEHRAIGNLYDQLADLTDKLAENYMGIYGRFGNVPCVHNELPNAVEYVKDMADMVQSIRMEMPNDTQLQNIVDEIASAIDTTNYLLTLN